MATITKYRRKKGTVYTAQIRLKRDGKIIHTESRTFSKRSLAAEWARLREAELEDPAHLARATHRGMTIAEMMESYYKEAGAKAGRTKKADILRIAKTDLGAVGSLRLTVQALIAHAQARHEGGASPQTILNDFVWLRVASRYARRVWGLPVDLQVIEDAVATLRDLKLVGKSRRRERRVSDDEIDSVCAWLRKHKRTEIPMEDIIRFAVHSSRRQSEITRLRVDDLDSEHRGGLVRDVKHPYAKEGNHKRCKFTPEAWEIIERQPLDGELVFPYNPRTVGAYFAQAVSALEIPDLRFHDLRHEATSRLFEKGYSIPEVQLFTLHDSWQELSRYTHLRPQHIKDR